MSAHQSSTATEGGDGKKLTWFDRLSPPMAAAVARGVSVLAGLAVALMFFYLLYRIGLPSKPFIYVAF